MNKNNITGFTGAILAAVTFGLNPLFALKLYDGGLSAQTVLFYRFGIGAILIAGMMLFKKAAFTFSRRNFIHLLIAGTCLMGTSIGLFLSFRFMDAGIASTILFTYPVMVTVIMAVFFKEKISFILITSMVLSLAGILIMCNPSAGVKMDIRGILLALLSAAAYAVYMVLIKESRLKHMQSETITFYAMLFSLPYFLIFGGELNIPFSNLSIILNLLGLALFPAFLSFYFLAIGLKHIGATKTAILGALEPLTAVCIGVFIYGEKFTWQLAIGIILIFTSVMLVIFSDTTKSTPSKTE